MGRSPVSVVFSQIGTSMQARLKVIQDNANLKQVKLLPITVIGRGADCQLKIASTQVSRRHCRITVTEKEVLIEDLNSANGTYVNQEKIPAGKPVVVAPGASLHIGPAAFVVDYTPPMTLETMPTTVLKSTELPFMKGMAAVSQPAAGKLPETAGEGSSTLNPPPVPTGSHVIAAELPSLAPSHDEPSATAESASPSKEETPEFTEFHPETETISPDEVTVRIPPPVVEVPAPVIAVSAPPVVEEKPVLAEQPAVPVFAAPVSPPRAAPVVAAPVVSAPAAAAPPVVAKAVTVTAAPLPADISAEQTVNMFSPFDETVRVAPPPAAAVPPASTFDFLGGGPASSPVPSFDAFNFEEKSPEPAPSAAAVPPAAANPAAAKKSLFGMFGKKEKSAATPVAVPAPAAPAAPAPFAMPAAPAATAAPAENPFAFFGEPAPVSQPAPVSPPAAAPAPFAAAAPVVPAPAPQPAAPAAPADDPFAFLKGV